MTIRKCQNSQIFKISCPAVRLNKSQQWLQSDPRNVDTYNIILYTLS